jgi:hypothetical protein
MILMKGPYERLKYDLRRLWECPQCHKRERTDGTVTFRLCSCQTTGGSQPIAMTLLEEAGHRTVPSIVPKISDESPAIEASAEPLVEPTIEPALPEVAGPRDESSGSLPPP